MLCVLNPDYRFLLLLKERCLRPGQLAYTAQALSTGLLFASLTQKSLDS